VTLEWAPCEGHGTVAYELQWRERGQGEQAWETAAQLLLGATVLKKNLKPGVCYEFRSVGATCPAPTSLASMDGHSCLFDPRVRAASAWGWSGYSDSIMVLTSGGLNPSPRKSSGDASSDAAK
jgi:hypothetical protein